jgi:hypothetical protein
MRHLATLLTGMFGLPERSALMDSQTVHGLDTVKMALLLAKFLQTLRNDSAEDMAETLSVQYEIRRYVEAVLARKMTDGEYRRMADSIIAVVAADAGTPARTTAVDAFVNAEFLNKPHP